MAITPNKKGVVTGTKKKDKITWAKKSIWQKNLTVNALAGNDTITFTNSTYKNKLNGGDGKDIIKGGKKNDTITGGTGNDTIYTGKGTNTLVINKGDGNDTIYTQGTKTTLKFNKPNSKDKANAFEKKGNDLILTYTHTKAKKDKKNVTEKLTLKNYYKNDGTIANNNIYIQDKKNQKVSSLVKDLKITGVNNEFRGTYKADIINGTGKADKIYGNGGNDTISAGNGNDIIYGNNGDDFIIGGKGADIINAGAGRNTIVHSAGDGDDIIVSGGGNDKLSFGGVDSIDEIIATYTDNDVIFELPNEEKITLQNALTNGHSVDTIEIGDDKYTTDRFKNLIVSHDAITNGTAWHDDIQVYDLPLGTYYPEIYAGAGNDIIYVSPFSRCPEIYVGAGDDTVSLVYDGSHNNIQSRIFFENGDGNNTLTGLSNNLSTLSEIDIFSDDLYNSIRLSDSLSYDYVTGTRDGNNLVLALTGGETFTIENYFGISLDLKEQIRIKGKGDSSSLYKLYKLLNYLKSEDDIITVDAEPNEIYEIEESSNKLIIAPEADFCRFRDISDNSNNNDIVIKGQEETLEVYSSNNNIYLGGGSHSVQLYRDGLTGNKIYFCADGGSIRTSDGGSTFISAKTDGYTSINSFGTDTLYLEKGQHYIHFDSNYDETVTISNETKAVDVHGVEVAKSTKITQQSTGKTVTDIMFEHYTNWKDSYNNDYLSVKYFDKNGAVLNGEDNNELLIYGKWEDNIFNLDNATVGDKVTVVAGLETKTLSQMSQYADMTNTSLNKLFNFANKAQNGLPGQQGRCLY